MLKRNSKAMAIFVAVAFCLTFLAPAFVTPDAAQAAGTYRALTEPTVSSSATSETLGTIEIDFPSGAEIASGDVLTVSFPAGVKASATQVNPVTVGIAKTAGEVSVAVPTDHPQTGNPNGLKSADITAKLSGTKQSLNITFNQPGTFNRSVIYVFLEGMVLDGCTGDLTATIIGSASSIPPGTVKVGKVSTDTGTAASIKGVTAIGSSAAALEAITLVETKKNSLENGEVVKIKLPAGFKWNGVMVGANQMSPGFAAGDWAFAATGPFVAAVDADNRILNINVVTTPGKTTLGKIDVIGVIQADDSVAKKGDVVAQIYSDRGHVTTQDLTVAKYGTYAANGEEGTVAELVAGKAEQKLGTFYISEELPGSIVPGRTIKLTLPAGLKWWGGYRTGNENFPALVLDKGNNILTTAGGQTVGFTVGANTNNSSDEGRTITLTVGQLSTTAAKIKFKDMKVDVSPEFKGDAKITIAGTAGAVGEVKVATVVAPVEMSVSNIAKVRIGEQKQATGDLIIKETKKDNIAFRNNDEWVNNDATAPKITAANNQKITLKMPIGVRWADLPKVEVTEGDLQLDIYNMAKGSAVVGGSDDRVVTIPVKSGSMTASTVKVSDIKVTIDRTVPEGDLKVSVGGLAINEVPNVFPNDSLPGQVIATVVTPAPLESGTATFRITSNIYEVNGVSRVMDVTPYIKAGRTYIPVRYLALALGVPDAGIVWDEATQKVTLTKGENKIELTIGSTTYTVNGESKTMDVAPEINNGRTMLPARYVAEGLGYSVGWDPATQTVLITK